MVLFSRTMDPPPPKTSGVYIFSVTPYPLALTLRPPAPQPCQHFPSTAPPSPLNRHLSVPESNATPPAFCYNSESIDQLCSVLGSPYINKQVSHKQVFRVRVLTWLGISEKARLVPTTHSHSIAKSRHNLETHSNHLRQGSRGFHGDIILIDEFSFVPHDVLYENALIQMVVENRSLIAISSPIEAESERMLLLNKKQSKAPFKNYFDILNLSTICTPCADEKKTFCPHRLENRAVWKSMASENKLRDLMPILYFRKEASPPPTRPAILLFSGARRASKDHRIFIRAQDPRPHLRRRIHQGNALVNSGQHRLCRSRPLLRRRVRVQDRRDRNLLHRKGSPARCKSRPFAPAVAACSRAHPPSGTP